MAEKGDKPLLLLEAAVDRDGREPILAEEAVQGLAPLHALGEDDDLGRKVREQASEALGSADLVEVEDIQEGEELAVLFLVEQVHVVLLEAVQSELGLVVHVDLHGLKKRKLQRDCEFKGLGHKQSA